jgi:hypothetical protein
MLTVSKFLTRALCIVLLLASVLALSHDTRAPHSHNERPR